MNRNLKSVYKRLLEQKLNRKNIIDNNLKLLTVGKKKLNEDIGFSPGGPSWFQRLRQLIPRWLDAPNREAPWGDPTDYQAFLRYVVQRYQMGANKVLLDGRSMDPEARGAILDAARKLGIKTGNPDNSIIITIDGAILVRTPLTPNQPSRWYYSNPDGTMTPMPEGFDPQVDPVPGHIPWGDPQYRPSPLLPGLLAPGLVAPEFMDDPAVGEPLPQPGAEPEIPELLQRDNPSDWTTPYR